MEARHIKFKSVVTRSLGIEFMLIECFQNACQIFNCLLLEEYACHTINYRCECAASAVGYDGATRGLCL